MGISLYGLTPATTYDALIKTGDNEPLTASLKVLSDGVGTNLPMEASTTGINFTGTTTVGGVAVANTTQVAAKQDTLVSGTNIKTINGTSVLGSGNIVTPTTSPSGVSGAIQFSDGSAFASDAANLFWNNTTKRLGVGTNAPSVKFDQQGGGALFNMGGGGTNSFRVQRGGSTLLNIGTDNASIYLTADGGNNGNVQFTKLNGSLLMQISDIGTVATIKGVGSTSATTSLLVQNSAGTGALKVTDDGIVSLNRISSLDGTGIVTMPVYLQSQSGNFVFKNSGSSDLLVLNSTLANFLGTIAFNNSSPSASACVDLTSTTKGFLPPRMTTTQKNAIATPAAGLVVYDNTTNKLCCYNGSTWNDLF